MENQTHTTELWQENTDARAQFLRKTYMHLAGAVLAFIIVEAILLKIPFVVETMLSLTVGWRWLLLLGGFMVATNFAENMAFNQVELRKQYIAM